MTQRQENFLTMSNVVTKLMEDNQTLWSTNDAVEECMGYIRDAQSAISAIRRGAGSAVSTGTTRGKDNASTYVTNIAIMLAGYAQVFARRKANEPLLAQMQEITRTSLARLSDDALPAELRGLLGRLEALGSDAAPYGITSSKLLEFTNAIEAYEAVMDAPRSVIVARKSANASIPVQLGVLRTELDNLDKLTETYMDDEPAFYAQYQNARIIIDRGGPRKSQDDTPEDNNPAS